jgi:hypothetical protein
MPNFKTLQQPLLGELAMSPERDREEERGEKNAIYSGHLHLCQQPMAAHALRSDQQERILSIDAVIFNDFNIFLDIFGFIDFSDNRSFFECKENVGTTFIFL